METGYYVSYFSDDKSWGKDLPCALIPGKTLDADIEQISQAIRAWILGRQNESFESLTIHLGGPFEGVSRTPVLTPEENLAASESQTNRFYALGSAAKSRFDAGDIETARTLALELQNMVLSYDKDWNYGNAVADVNIVLGRIALKQGDIREAEAFLIEAGKTPGSPQLNSFGPNMSLAQDLLLAGQSAAVLEYFELCERFWDGEFSKLDQWAKDVKAGRIPEFGASLVY